MNQVIRLSAKNLMGPDPSWQRPDSCNRLEAEALAEFRTQYLRLRSKGNQGLHDFDAVIAVCDKQAL
jgi:hypothetical protein